MLFDRTQQELVLEFIRRGAEERTAEDVATLLKLGTLHKPSDYDKKALGARMRLEGKQHDIVQAHLAVRFPDSYERMPIIAHNYMRHFAMQDAGVYVDEPERSLRLAADESDLPPEHELSKLFARRIREAKLRRVMPEFEIVANALRIAIGVVDWDSDHDKPVITLYGPDACIAVCHESGPADVSRMIIFAHRITGPNGVGDEAQWWRVLTREPIEHENGQVTFGKVKEHRISSKGEAYFAGDAPETDRGLDVMPIFVAQTALPQGSIFPEVDEDLCRTSDAMNGSLSNTQWTMDFQGHDEVWLASSSKEDDEIAGGPDAIMHIGTGEQMGVLSRNPKIQDAIDLIEAQLRTTAATRGNSPTAYSTRATAPVSGISRQIENIPHERTLRRNAYAFQDCEEQMLLPLLMKMNDLHAPPGVPRFGDAYVPVMKPAKQKDIVEPETQARYVQQLRDMKLISQAQAAVLAAPQLYPTIADAVGAGLSDKIEGAVLPGEAPAEKPGLAQSLRDAAKESLPPNLEDTQDSDEIETVPNGRPVKPASKA